MKKKILIIGAGIAGLAAANKLAAHGLDVTVLEARNRIGGRIATDHSLGIPFDTGATWIHGIADNPITALAKQTDVKYLHSNFTQFLFFDRKKNIIPIKELTGFYEKFYPLTETISKDAYEKNQDISLADALSSIKPQFQSQAWNEIWNWAVARLGLYSNANLNYLSARYWDEEKTLNGGNHLIINGYSTLLRPLVEGYDVKLNTPVKNIDYQQKKIVVTTQQEIFYADKILVTLPLGVLKKGTVTFSPQFPNSKQKAIDQLAMGVLNRIALKFPTTFWPINYHGFYLSPQTTPTISHFINYQYYFQQPILVGAIDSNKALELELLNDQELIALAVEQLRYYFGSHIPWPETYLITRWSQDPYSYGSYSYIPVNATGADYDILAEPIDDRVFFAGEATNRYYLASTHGAYWSGIREADRIIKLSD